MKTPEAKRRAAERYRKKAKHLNISFPPKQSHMYYYLKSKDVPMAEYVKGLIEQDMINVGWVVK